jgi:hypothetical protein
MALIAVQRGALLLRSDSLSRFRAPLSTAFGRDEHWFPPPQRGHVQQLLSSLEHVSPVELVTLSIQCGECSAAAKTPNLRADPSDRRSFHTFRLRARVIPFRTVGTGRCPHVRVLRTIPAPLSASPQARKMRVALPVDCRQGAAIGRAGQPGGQPLLTLPIMRLWPP